MRGFSVLVAATAVVSGAHALPTSLAFMPIADILGDREGLATYTLTGYERKFDKRYTHTPTLTLGFGDKFELGLVNDTMGTTTLNGKWQVWSGEKHALSVGFNNWRNGAGDRYAVGRVDFDQFRLHGGYYWDGEDHLMLGVDFSIGDCAVGVDHFGGRVAYTSAIVTIPVKGIDRLSVSLMGTFPNTRRESVAHFVTLNYGFRF